MKKKFYGPEIYLVNYIDFFFKYKTTRRIVSIMWL